MLTSGSNNGAYAQEAVFHKAGKQQTSIDIKKQGRSSAAISGTGWPNIMETYGLPVLREIAPTSQRNFENKIKVQYAPIVC